MAEAQNYLFDYKEVAEALVKKQGIHEGLWGIYMEFGIAGANAGPSEDALVPTVIIPVVKIGIQRFEKPSNLTVNAADVNPQAVETSKTSGGPQRARTRKVKV